MEMDQAAQDYSLGYSNFLEILAQANTPKKKGPVTLEQRQLMLDFIYENPELITHSSTKESEIELWEALKDQLNALEPERSVESWKKFWREWKGILKKRPESTWTMIDFRLNKFLTQIGGETHRSSCTTSGPLTLKQLDDQINVIEHQKRNLNFEIDQMDYEIMAHRNSIIDLKRRMEEKKRTCRNLQSKKLLLHKKKMNILQNGDSGKARKVVHAQKAPD